jgi:hypothetical protein
MQPRRTPTLHRSAATGDGAAKLSPARLCTTPSAFGGRSGHDLAPALLEMAGDLMRADELDD